MITIFIKELDENDKLKFLNNVPIFFHKALKFIKKLINKFYINEINENSKIYIIPNPNKKHIYKYVVKKLEKEVTKTQKVQIVLSNNMKKYINYFKDFKILDGKNFMKDNIDVLLEKILSKDITLESQDIYVLTNKYNENSISLIKNMQSKYKSINIITKEIEKYNMLEHILNDEPIVYSVANNKKKSLKKAKIIINIDFNEEQIKQYLIYRNAIIINLNNFKIKNLKNFEGIIIQNVDIDINVEQQLKFKNENIINNFRNIELYESINKNEKFLKDIDIKYFCGNNGIISLKEIINIRKILTNY